ncbi:hypothetical protein R1sor_002033 [Riccia sorocarpa]|uniref:Uncharacterized protein n=1 Tax=Riccia sorocarpa TaxID=122646 RepID=A0ABD3H1U0_9MARC
MPVEGILKLAIAEMEAEAVLYRDETMKEWTANQKWLLSKVTTGNTASDLESEEENESDWDTSRNNKEIRVEDETMNGQRTPIPTEENTTWIRRARRVSSRGQDPSMAQGNERRPREKTYDSLIYSGVWTRGDEDVLHRKEGER